MAKELNKTDKQLKTVEQKVPRAIDGGERTHARAVFVPRTDIYETEESIILLAEMPGVAPDAVDITLEKRLLTIHGHAGDQEHEGYRQIYAEYAEGDYERVFTLSEDIDQDRIEASQSDGILRLVLPKAEPAKARKIQVKAA
ncbi:Hsp20/alpha crystallin family protein [Rhodospirillaceae bacterium SYSU D60014]|uniref:Hsp20/alpha crystallin family protein n=1 Tax=Virgifigura deserti TaxID=2268457 RepID=UPI000E662DE7